ncbi:MAG: hydantoinase B/oxoprolinase family protein [Candidatus Acidiferrales bacterium]
MNFDPTRLEIFKNLFHSVAEEMGSALRRSAYSPNIKERRDYSCAVFDAKGEVLAMGDHMPVHLGSMPKSVRAVREKLTLDRGDIALLNDPYAGGTHLPDLTMVMPVFLHGEVRPFFYVANRAHHADIGGGQAGSMGVAREIFQEGLRIPPVKILERGRIVPGVIALLLENVRTPREREGDLTAQVAACRIGERRVGDITRKFGRAVVREYGRHLLDYSERMMSIALRHIPAGTYRAEDFLDDDGISGKPIRIHVSIEIGRGRATVDFTGSAPQCAGSVNAVRAIAESAVFYVFRCLIEEDVPATSGLLRPIRIITPEGTIVNARPPAAVAGGNVETSQRMVDTLLRALSHALPGKIPAASQGTMNNLTLGGVDPRTCAQFAYYETIAGGMGARPGLAGASGIHTHMTNSLNTPIEAFEHSYPIRVRRYGLRRGSGGAGEFRGGDGIIREIELLEGMHVGFLSDRRKIGPYGLWGGKAGARGVNEIIMNGRARKLPSKCSLHAPRGSILRISTPGGGGWRPPRKKSRSRKTKRRG